LQPLELPPSQTPTFDVDASITHKDADGNDLFNIDIDSYPEGERNWRKSGVNTSDYFNYGMNEATWRNYVRKQRDMRESESAERNPFIVRFFSYSPFKSLSIGFKLTNESLL